MTPRDPPAATTACIAGCGVMAIGIRNEHVDLPTHAMPAGTVPVPGPAQRERIGPRPGRPGVGATAPPSTEGSR